jgi:hypothetical protein
MLPDAASLPTYKFFKNAEEAWFWYCRHQALKEGSSYRPQIPRLSRPCSLSDIYVCVVKLSLCGILKKRHVNTLVKFGRRLSPPDHRLDEEVEEAIWWEEAMDKLQTIMLGKGFVAA